MSDKPNPGSLEAREKGCKCPVDDNNRGKRAPFPPDGWWMVLNCPIHGERWANPKDESEIGAVK